ncbi:MAG TPA: PAS domain S-box protein, partial [Acidimicrobiales bacterium]|nr:PAS domain S-box protein [Acidimicrobiales bacterium]
MSDALRVVVVDDAPEVRAVLTSELRVASGFDIVGQGANGNEAIDLVSRLAPDLVLLDVSMPDMDGLDALVAIRVASPSTKVVMFSGFAGSELAERARSLGAAAFLQKDLPTEQLPDRLRAIAGVTTPTQAPTPAPPPPAPTTAPASEVMSGQVERFRDMFDQATIGMATLTLGGKIVRSNPALLRLAGVSAEHLTGRPYVDIASSASAQAVEASIADVVAGRRDVSDLEHRLGIPYGERWVLSTIAAVRDSSGRPLYLFLQVQDVTARHEAQEALGISEAQFRLLVEGVAEYAIFMLDPFGHIASWNAGAQRIKGWTAKEVIGRHFRLFYTQADRDRRHPEHELEIATAEGRYEEEGVRVRKDGTTFWASVVITALHGPSGDLVGFAKVTRDITERV